MDPLISVIILNLNGRHYLEKCLDSLFRQSFPSFEVIVVDNGSSDGSADQIKKKYPQVNIIENEFNRGFAAGNNQGISIAKGKYIATLNNDTETRVDWLKKLLDVAESDEGIGMCASKILNIEHRDIIDSTGILLYPDGMSRGRGRLEKDDGRYGQVEEILLPSACAALYRKKMLDEIGLFDEDFFAYCEDTDLGLRGRLAGWKAVFVPSARVYHHYSMTGGKYSTLKAFLVERNHIWCAVKNFPMNHLLALPFYTLWRFLVAFYGVGGKRGPGSQILRHQSIGKVIWVLLRAYGSAIRGLPSAWRKRRSIQSRRQASIKDFSTWIRLYRLSAAELMLKD